MLPVTLAPGCFEALGDAGADRVAHGEGEDRAVGDLLGDGDHGRGSDHGEGIVIGGGEVAGDAGDERLVAVGVLFVERHLGRRHAVDDRRFELGDDVVEHFSLGDREHADRDRLGGGAGRLERGERRGQRGGEREAAGGQEEGSLIHQYPRS